jgi:hypothetical protein
MGLRRGTGMAYEKREKGGREKVVRGNKTGR